MPRSAVGGPIAGRGHDLDGVLAGRGVTRRGDGDGHVLGGAGLDDRGSGLRLAGQRRGANQRATRELTPPNSPSRCPLAAGRAEAGSATWKSIPTLRRRQGVAPSLFVRLRRLPGPLARISPSGGSGTPRGPAGRSGPGRWSLPPPPRPLPSSPCSASKRRAQRRRPVNTALPTTDRSRIGSVSSIETADKRDATVLTTSRVALPQSTRRARPTGFEPVTFGFVDRVGSRWTRLGSGFGSKLGLELVWARLDSVPSVALLLPSSRSEVTPPHCCFAWKAALHREILRGRCRRRTSRLV